MVCLQTTGIGPTAPLTKAEESVNIEDPKEADIEGRNC
jgi:hypothetical protein